MDTHLVFISDGEDVQQVAVNFHPGLGTKVEAVDACTHKISQAKRGENCLQIIPGHTAECLFCIHGEKKAIGVGVGQPMMDIDRFDSVVMGSFPRINQTDLVRSVMAIGQASSLRALLHII